MRLMFLGDRIMGKSAYSKVGYETCTRLAALGHTVAHIPIGLVNRMGKQGFQNILLYPSGRDYFAEDVAIDHYCDFKADILFVIKEPWVLNNIFRHAINLVPLAVIDHSPVSPSITSRLPSAFKIIAVSRFGQLELERVNFKSEFIPHGVRSDVYQPLSDEEKQKSRKLFFIPEDHFVVGIVAMNRVRKMIPRMLRGYKRFLECNPDVKSTLYLFTNVQPRKHPEDITVGVSDVGVSLLPEIINLKLDKNVIFPQWSNIEKVGGLPEYDSTGGWDMVRLYNCFNVNYLCSGGEAAGLTYLEAAACGVPSIGTNYAGAPEYIGPGITVPWYDYDILNTPGARYVFADVDKMAEALTKIMNGNPEKMRRKARRFAERFDWSNIMEKYWVPFLQQCADELYPLVTDKGVKCWA